MVELEIFSRTSFLYLQIDFRIKIQKPTYLVDDIILVGCRMDRFGQIFGQLYFCKERYRTVLYYSKVRDGPLRIFYVSTKQEYSCLYRTYVPYVRFNFHTLLNPVKSIFIRILVQNYALSYLVDDVSHNQRYFFVKKKLHDSKQYLTQFTLDKDKNKFAYVHTVQYMILL